MKGIGGKATVDKAEANDWLDVSASARIVITDLSPLSLLRAFLIFLFQLLPALPSDFRLFLIYPVVPLLVFFFEEKKAFFDFFPSLVLSQLIRSSFWSCGNSKTYA